MSNRDENKLVIIPGELKSAAIGPQNRPSTAAAGEVFDYTLDKYQDVLNQKSAYINSAPDSSGIVQIQDASANNVYPKTLENAVVDENGNTIIYKLNKAVDDEETRAKAAEQEIAGDVSAIGAKIPTQASSENQLADKAFVNSSISTATANFKGTFNLVSGLHLDVTATNEQIAAALDASISGEDNNDYAFVQVPTSVSTPTEIAKISRFKYNGTTWVFEYDLNNSGFTASQWASINSGITSGLVTTFGNKYDKPSGGIPSTDMTEAVQTSLSKADSAYQKPSGGIPGTDMTKTVQASLDNADTAVQPNDLANVAFSGSYNDLENKPTIPAAQIQSDWNQTNVTKPDYIQNKPTNVSAFTNDKGYIDSSTLDDNLKFKENLIGKGTCTTDSSVAAKTVTVSNDWVLTENAMIVVKFNNDISTTSSTLSVNGGTAKPIFNKGAALEPDVILANTEIILRYDGTNFNVVGGAGDGSGAYEAGNGISIDSSGRVEIISVDNTVARLEPDDSSAVLPDYDPGIFIGDCNTAAGTAAKTVDIVGYELIRRGAVAIRFINGITVDNATLNVSSMGAKAIYYRGAILNANVVHAGDTLTMVYDGTKYVVIAIEDGNVSVTYDSTTKGMIFPSNSGVTYDPNTKGMIF